MIPEKFKEIYYIPIENIIKEFLGAVFDTHSKYLVEDADALRIVSQFAKEFEDLRNIIGKLNFAKLALGEAIQVLWFYIQMLEVLIDLLIMEQRLLLESYGWSDVNTQKIFFSKDIYYEYYSTFFNLGVAFIQTARQNTTTDELFAIQNFQNAAWTFEKISNEMKAITTSDMSELSLRYYSKLCLAEAQSLKYYGICNLKKDHPGYQRLANIAQGASELYDQVHQLSSGLPQIAEPTRVYLLNRKYFFAAQACLNMEEYWGEYYETHGTEFGTRIAYLKIAVQFLREGEKTISKSTKFLNVNKYISLKEQIENNLTEMMEKNMKINLETIPGKLPTIQSEILAIPNIPEREPEKLMISQIKKLVPKKVKPLLFQYKTKMNEYICGYLSHCENDMKIEAFLKNNIGNQIEFYEISDAIWIQLKKIHMQGGYQFLLDKLTYNTSKSESISKSLCTLEELISSNTTLAKLTKNIQQYHSNLKSAVTSESEVCEQLKEYKQVYEKIDFSTKMVPINLLNISTLNELQIQLNFLESFKNQCMKIINQIFEMLNNDSEMIPQLYQVILKRRNLDDVIKESQFKYYVLLEDLTQISEKIRMVEEVIIDIVNQIFSKEKTACGLKYEKYLEKMIQFYQKKIEFFEKGVKFYSVFEQEIEKLIAKVGQCLDDEANVGISFRTTSHSEK